MGTMEPVVSVMDRGVWKTEIRFRWFSAVQIVIKFADKELLKHEKNRV